MRGKSVGVAALLLAAGCGLALAQSSGSEATAPTRSTTGNPLTAPTINPSAVQAHNPMVNPNAAGTQMPWHGYAPTSNATENARQGGAGVRRGGALLGPPARPLPPVTRPLTAVSARDRLAQLGYRRITRLRRTGNGGWLARAQWSNRQVLVQLDDRGEVVGQR